ncbi:MAG: PD-(D/E)XK nuclease family protein [Acidobacteria bacterium]|nr:PD-(D/E)XK nuclease family protein [Acidobacteriota bacterium]
MDHRIYAGPFVALEPCLSEEIRRLQAGDPLSPVNVLVGSNVLAAYLKRRVVADGPGIANLRFYTFIDLALRLAAPVSGEDPRARMPRLGPARILQSILAGRIPRVFEPVREFGGFRDALLSTFRDLRDAEVTAEALDRLVRACAREFPDRRDHLSGFARLYREFRGQAALFRDDDDDFRDALRGVPKAAETLVSPALLVYGIYDVTGQQRSLLERLKDSLDLVYFIPFVDEDVSSFALPFLELTAQTTGAPVRRLEAPGRGDDLGRLWKHGCGLAKQSPGIQTPPGPFRGDGSVLLVSAPGESRAAIEINREIVRAVSEGIIEGFHEAAVILRHPEDDLPALTESFRLRRIPCYVHGGVPFAGQPLARAVSAVIALASGPFPREAILATMELIAACLPPEQARDWDVPEWRLLTNDVRFLAGVQSWDEGTGSLIRELSERLSEAGPARAAVEDGDAGPEAPGTLRERLESARRLRGAWMLLRSAAASWPGALRWAEWAAFLEGRLLPLLGASVEWASFAHVLDELSALDEIACRSGSSRAVQNAELADALSESMATLAAPSGRFMRGGVNILTVSAARGLRFPLVIVPGLEEAGFPARLRQDPLLQDEERARVGPGFSLPLRSRRVEEERLLFDMAARSATRRLVLISSRLDESSDREKIPSEFFLRVAAVAAGRPVLLRDLAEGAIPGFRSVSLEDPAPRPGQAAIDEGEIRMRLIRGLSGSERGVLEALAAIEPELLRGPAAFDRARWQRRLTAYDGLISDGGLLAWLSRNVGASSAPFSAGRIEDYARCPYLFYLKRVQELEPWEELEPAECLDALTRGSVIHRILEQFVKRHSRTRLASAPREELGERLREIALEHLESARPAGIPDLLWEIERDRILLVLDRWLEFELDRADDGLVPVFTELPFGDMPGAEGNPGLAVSAGRHSFTLRGLIDRVDISDDGSRARIVDYKAGSLPATMAGDKGTALMAGERLQLAVYDGALRRLPNLKRVQMMVEGEFLHLQPSDGTIAVRRFAPEEMERALATLPGILEVVGDGIEGGRLFARTRGALYGDRQCLYCKYARICGKDRERREERKSADPAVVQFSRMAEIDGLGGDEG